MTPQSNPLILWFIETLNRIFTKSPKFFRIWQMVAGAVALVGWIPSTLELVGIAIPEPYTGTTARIIKWCGTIALFMASLPTQSKVVAIDECGDAMKQTDKKELPFTARQEDKQVAQNPTIKTV